MESRRSCCSSFLCCGMAIKRGCFVFSIINAVICSLATLGSLIFLIFILYSWFYGSSRDSLGDGLSIMYMVLSLACCVASGMALTFAVVLCLGIQRNNKGYLMAYLIYGTITVTLSLMGTVGFIWCGVGLTKYALISIGICVVYTGILVLVYQTNEVIAESERTPHASGSFL